MSNEKKTLADVQPGGRVRLGDSLAAVVSDIRAHCNPTDPESDDEVSAAYALSWADRIAALSAQPSPPSSLDLEAMLAACVPGGDIADPQVIADNIRRWFAAQPSPGGQGGLNYERMFVDACAALAEVSRELGCDPEQGGAEPILAAIAELREALAARQPVGQIPAGFTLVPEKFGIPADVWEGVEFVIGGPGTGEGESYLDSTAWIGDLMQDDGSSIYGLHLSCDECPEDGSVTLAEFAAPPAQAVDLGQFRQPVQDWLDDAQASMEEHGDYDGAFGYVIEEGTRLLALIDSHSAGGRP